MKTAVAIMLVAGTVMASDLSNPKVIQDAADKAVGGAASPSLVNPSVDPGIVVAPTAGGAVVASDVGQTARSIGKVGFWQTIKNVPSSYPKTVTALAVLAAAAPIIANNPKLIGLQKPGDSATSGPQANGNTTSSTKDSPNNSVTVNVSGNSGSAVTVLVQSPTTSGKE